MSFLTKEATIIKAVIDSKYLMNQGILVDRSIVISITINTKKDSLARSKGIKNQIRILTLSERVK